MFERKERFSVAGSRATSEPAKQIYSLASVLEMIKKLDNPDTPIGERSAIMLEANAAASTLR